MPQIAGSQICSFVVLHVTFEFLWFFRYFSLDTLKLHQQNESLMDNFSWVSFYSLYFWGDTANINSRMKWKNGYLQVSKLSACVICLPAETVDTEKIYIGKGPDTMRIHKFFTTTTKLSIFMHFSVLYLNLKTIHYSQDSMFKSPPLNLYYLGQNF